MPIYMRPIPISDGVLNIRPRCRFLFLSSPGEFSCLTSDCMTLSRRVLNSSEMADCWSPGPEWPGDERPVLDAGASPRFWGAEGSGRAESDMMGWGGEK